MNLSKNKSLILLHLIILIWGFTGILGKLITLPSDVIVWNRMIISFISLYIIHLFQKNTNNNKINFQLSYFFIGILIAIHWIFFFESIKLSTVSLALICLSSVSLFTAILEPIMKKKTIRLYEVILSIFVTIGIGVVFNYENTYSTAIILAIASAFFASIFTILNYQLIQKGHDSLSITIWEMFGGSCVLTIYLLLNNNFNTSNIPSSMEIL